MVTWTILSVKKMNKSFDALKEKSRLNVEYAEIQNIHLLLEENREWFAAKIDNDNELIFHVNETVYKVRSKEDLLQLAKLLDRLADENNRKFKSIHLEQI